MKQQDGANSLSLGIAATLLLLLGARVIAECERLGRDGAARPAGPLRTD